MAGPLTNSRSLERNPGETREAKMKRKIRIVLALGLMAALFTAGHAAPALADDGSPVGVTQERSPDPCTLVETRLVNLGIAQEERD